MLLRPKLKAENMFEIPRLVSVSLQVQKYIEGCRSSLVKQATLLERAEAMNYFLMSNFTADLTATYKSIRDNFKFISRQILIIDGNLHAKERRQWMS